MNDLQKVLAVGEISQRALDELESKFALIRQNLHDTWEGTKSNESDRREAAYRQLHALNEIERAFNRDIDSAKMASKELETEHVRKRT